MADIAITYDRVLSIIGGVIRIALPKETADDPEGPRFGDLAVVSEGDTLPRLAQVVRVGDGEASLQVFAGVEGLSTRSRVRFLGHAPKAVFSPSVLGRVFAGDGRVLDRGPSLDHEPKVEVDGPSANPARRAMASGMIRTDVP
ncbi:MAG: V-type ATP synthase subunit B, partial [Acidobacteria bacterium]|nr:V-type ATP synthase subunit B [Acidobacteriota bacterium]